jgi:hypothetical protein
MAAIFGITPEAVRSHYFPHQSTFDETTIPSVATVTEIISEEAAELAAHLAGENLDGSSFVAGTDAYVWSAGTLRRMAAIRVVQAGIAMDPQVLDDWKTVVGRRLAHLDEKGRTALGTGVSNPTVEPNGPTHHLDVHGIASPTVVTTAADILRTTDEL